MSLTLPPLCQVVNVLVKRLLRGLCLIQFGREYFYTTPMHLSEYSLSMYSGFSCTGPFFLPLSPPRLLNVRAAPVCPTLDGLQLVVDLCHRVFRTRSVRELMDQIEDEARCTDSILRIHLHAVSFFPPCFAPVGWFL